MFKNQPIILNKFQVYIFEHKLLWQPVTQCIKYGLTHSVRTWLDWRYSQMHVKNSKKCYMYSCKFYGWPWLSVTFHWQHVTYLWKNRHVGWYASRQFESVCVNIQINYVSKSLAFCLFRKLRLLYLSNKTKRLAMFWLWLRFTVTKSSVLVSKWSQKY